MKLKQSLHSLLSDNEIVEVINQLRSLPKDALSNLRDEVEQVAARYEANLEQSSLEFADELSTNKENARIKYLLLSIINRLPEDAELPSAVMQRRSKMAVFIVLGLVLLAAIAFNLDFFKKEEPILAPKPVPEQIKTVVTPASVALNVVVQPQTPTASAVTPPLVDSLKLDTLPKKKLRRVRKTPVVVPEQQFGISE
ncbi:MAG: hypothetical protein U5L45_06385 [Saprospiraceae bacterium]|nr:hypothetical protein [Saprospiraceae bacterium]